MEISNSNYKILQKILNGEITNLSEANMQKSNFIYALGKINDFLLSLDLPEIEKSGNSIIVPKELEEKKNQILKRNNKIYLTNEERILACELLIGCESNQVYLKDYMSILEVSKNTAYNDIKELRTILEKEGINVEFTRKDGYFLHGNELIIRKRIGYILESLYNDLKDVEIIERICNVTKDQLESSKKTINEIEEELEVHFVESKTNYLPYLVSILINRINKGRLIKENALFFNELSDTFEFNKAHEIVNKTYNLENVECYYITLLFLSTSVSKFNLVDSQLKNELSNSITQMIDNFEKNACIQFDEKDRLHRNILQHMIAAYYRIKYDLTLSKEMVEAIQNNTDSQEFQLVYKIVEKSIEPLQQFIETEIPIIEQHFLVLQFLAWIRKQNLSPLTKPRAVVVCLNGVTISNLIYLSLKELFPEFVFVDVVSYRDFNKLDENKYDIVFSTIDLNTSKKLFVINNIIEFKDKNNIRNRVFAELYDQKIPKTDLGIVYKTIDQKLSPDMAEELKEAINKNLQKNNKIKTSSLHDQQNFIDMISANRINIINSVLDYKEAIRLSGKPLLKEGLITEEYIKTIINNYDYSYPNIVFGSEIAVPHASVEDGSKGLAMSLLKINNGVNFGNELLVHFVIMLAPIDRSSHLKALAQLTNLAFDESGVERLKESCSKEEILKIIKIYSESED